MSSINTHQYTSTPLNFAQTHAHGEGTRVAISVTCDGLHLILTVDEADSLMLAVDEALHVARRMIAEKPAEA